MIFAIRYLLGLVLVTAHQALRVVLAALAGTPFRPGHVYDDAPRSWGRIMLRLSGVRATVHGAERIPAGPCVFVSNHASFVDVWLLVATLPGSVRFVAKKELFRIPLLGRAMRASGQIAIDRRNRREAFSAYDEAATAVRSGLSAVVFAEGTRGSGAGLQEFKKGPFVLAIAAGVPVVPVLVEGTWRVLPRGALLPRPGAVALHVLDPIPTAGMGYDDRDRLSAATRGAMLAVQPHLDAAPPGVDGVSAAG